MKMTGISERLKEIMKERNLRQTDILSLVKPYADELGIKLNKSDLSQYLSGKVIPGRKKLKALSLGLDVNETWLLGYSLKDFTSHLSCLDKELIELIYPLTERHKKMILEDIKEMLYSEKE